VNQSNMSTSECKNTVEIRFVALLVTEYDEVLLGYQPGQMVEW
jgi:hypothetical protein